MNTALIYRAKNRGLVWIALICAIAVDLGAIAIAENRSRSAVPTWGNEVSVVIATDEPEPPPPKPEEFLPPEQIPEVANDDAFPQENSTPPPVPRRKKSAVVTAARVTGIAPRRGMYSASAKAMALFAPRPAYPYEARRRGIVGSGVVELTINSEVGNVISVRMAGSTGSPILDNATVDALRRWRFKAGLPTNIRVPITFTLSGVSY